jgi:amidohydrolase
LRFAFSFWQCRFLPRTSLDQKIDSNIQDWVGTYKHLHQNPELSTLEKETSAFVADALKKLGYHVTDHFGDYENPDLTSYGIVAVMQNGPGPAVSVRTELDALPVKEDTGVPYVSQVTVKHGGGDVGVMHGCGRDLHMTVFLGTAKMLAGSKNQWSSTVVMIGQPAEEAIGGAKAMIRAGLFSKFPKPDYVLALHDNPLLAAGKVAWKEGNAAAESAFQ